MRILVVSVAIWGLAGCDDGDSGGGGGGGSINSGVDETKTVSELSDAEADQICEAADAYGETLITKEQGCIFGSLLFAPDAAACQQFVDMCLQQPDEPDDEEDGCTGLPDELQNCTATVGEVEACMEAISNKLRSTVSGLSCNDAGNEQRLQALGEALNLDPATVPACKTVQDKCPEAFMNQGDEI